MMNAESIAASLPIFMRGFTQFEMVGVGIYVEDTHYRYDLILQKAEWLDTPIPIMFHTGPQKESGMDRRSSDGQDDWTTTDHLWIEPEMPFPIAPMGPN